MAKNYQAYIPDDLLPSILRHLPSKSLLRFITVSKSWCKLIKSPGFRALHLSHHKSLPHRVLLVKCDTHFYLFDQGNPVGRRLIRLPSPPDDFNTVAASYRTLICLSSSKNDDSSLLLWNPSINQFRKIKPPLGFKFKYKVGLGCIPVEDDGYKIVLISYANMVSRAAGHLNPAAYAQVYSYASSEWKAASLPYHFTGISQACVVNDFIHWIVFRRGFSESILIFDPRIDCFSLMQLPAPLKRQMDPDVSLAMVDDSLAVILHVTGEGLMQVWKVEEDGLEMSWKISCWIGLLCVGEWKCWDRQCCNQFITTGTGKLIVIYSMSDNVDACKGYVGMTGGMNGGQAFAYTQSLVLLDRKSE